MLARRFLFGYRFISAVYNNPRGNRSSWNYRDIDAIKKDAKASLQRYH